MEATLRLCECGCGQATTIPLKGNSNGRIKGQPMRFVTGHNSRAQVAAPTNRNQYGYLSIKRKLIHVLVVEQALGHPLSKGTRVHHIDEDRKNNTNGNLVACQDQDLSHAAPRSAPSATGLWKPLCAAMRLLPWMG